MKDWEGGRRINITSKMEELYEHGFRKADEEEWIATEKEGRLYEHKQCSGK